MGCDDMCIVKKSICGCSLRVGSFIAIIYALLMGITQIISTFLIFGYPQHNDNITKKAVFGVFTLGGTFLIVGSIELLIGVLRYKAIVIDISRLLLSLFFRVSSIFFLILMILQFTEHQHLFGFLMLVFMFAEFIFHKYILIVVLSYQKQLEATDKEVVDDIQHEDISDKNGKSVPKTSLKNPKDTSNDDGKPSQHSKIKFSFLKIPKVEQNTISIESKPIKKHPKVEIILPEEIKHEVTSQEIKNDSLKQQNIPNVDEKSSKSYKEG